MLGISVNTQYGRLLPVLTIASAAGALSFFSTLIFWDQRIGIAAISAGPFSIRFGILISLLFGGLSMAGCYARPLVLMLWEQFFEQHAASKIEKVVNIVARIVMAIAVGFGAVGSSATQ